MCIIGTVFLVMLFGSAMAFSVFAVMVAASADRKTMASNDRPAGVRVELRVVVPSSWARFRSRWLEFKQTSEFFLENNDSGEDDDD